MEARALAATGLLTLALGGFSTPASLQRVDPILHPDGRTLRLPGAPLGFAWARQGSTLALVVKPVATGQPIRLVDTRRMRVTRIVPVGDRDVCGLAYDQGTLVALAADQPCYWPGGHFSVLRIGKKVSVVPVPGLTTAAPTNLAFGDGKAFVAYAGGTIDAVDLHTGALRSHRPRRMLAKGEGIVFTRWLGGHLLGVGARTVDVRSWRSRVPDPHALGVAAGGSLLADYGRDGVVVRTRAGRLVRRVLPGEDVSDVRIVGRLLYAQVGQAIDVVDLANGRPLRVVPEADRPWLLVAP